MAKRRSERFLSRLREALSRFSDGVHALSAPATTQADIPGSLLELYELADGLWLFDDLVRIVPLAEVRSRSVRGATWIECGEVEGARLCVDERGRVYEEDDDGDRLLTAESIEEDLLARIARESLIVDAEGEWKEVFEPNGELVPGVRRKRNEAARKRAPNGARWLVEAAELALELDGDEAAAEALLVEALALDPVAAAVHELLGVVLVARGDLAGGARALALAADESGPVRRADRAAAAALAMANAKDDDGRARLAAMALEAEPTMAERLSTEAEAALGEGRLEDADRLRGLAAAVAGRDSLSPRLRARDLLRPIR